MKKLCPDCGLSAWHHLFGWLSELIDRQLPDFEPPQKIGVFFDSLLEKLFTAAGLFRPRNDFTKADIPQRTFLFLTEMRKRGAVGYGFKTPFGWADFYKIIVGKKTFRFQGLPTALFKSKYPSRLSDDKWLAKQRLEKAGFPVAEGRAFWLWQREKAMAFGKKLGFPLVVKPRSGSVSRHVSTDVRNLNDLKKAIDWTLVYSPAFIVEKYLADTFVHRATVIDFDFVAVDKAVPANVVGDGVSSLGQLIEIKNKDPLRGPAGQRQSPLHPILVDQASKELLAQNINRYNLESVPKNGELVYLQKDSFLRLGADIIEVTAETHPENRRLFSDVARHFDIRLVGIDFLAEDIARPWREQTCAVLELNSLPAFESHHFPFSGPPQNVAEKIADLFFKYYV